MWLLRDVEIRASAEQKKPKNICMNSCLGGVSKKAAARLTFVLTPEGAIYKTTVVATANLLPGRGLEQSLEQLRSRLRVISGEGFVCVSNGRR